MHKRITGLMGSNRRNSRMLFVPNDAHPLSSLPRRSRRRNILMGLLFGAFLLYLFPIFGTNPSRAKAGSKIILKQPKEGTIEGTDLSWVKSLGMRKGSKKKVVIKDVQANAAKKKAKKLAQVAAATAAKHPIINGLLEVDLNLAATQHPIYQLVEDAKTEWEAKNARQSRTLGEAVKEYQRRHGRRPPKGFDHWWNYVQEHDVQLPDEFDQIMRDLTPFYAYRPQDLRKINQRLMKEKQYTATISVKDGRAFSHNLNFPTDWETNPLAHKGSIERCDGQVAHIKDVAKYISDFDAVFNIHDTPLSFVSAGHLRELQDLVADGEFFDPGEEADRGFSSWGAACPSSSALHSAKPENLTWPYQPADLPKSFIKSHVDTMNLCEHPEVIQLHATTAGVNPLPQDELLPIFSLSKTALHSDIGVIPDEQWGEEVIDDRLPWATKNMSKLIWRGRNTGAQHNKKVPWRLFHRSRLAHMVRDDLNEKIPVLPAPKSKAISTKLKLQDVTLNVAQNQLTERLLDIGLAYEAVRDQKDGTCDDIVKELVFAPVMTYELEKYCRYILDIDGNAWSARFKRVLTTGSLILKGTIFPEWWNDRIQPWYHYIPVKVDYGDVYDIMTFILGDGTEGSGEEKIAREIAANGKHWSLNSWRREDMTAYMFRLWLEWARILSLDRESMDFIYEGN